ELEIAGESRAVLDLDGLLVEGLDQSADATVDGLAVHWNSPIIGTRAPPALVMGPKSGSARRLSSAVPDGKPVASPVEGPVAAERAGAAMADQPAGPD